MPEIVRTLSLRGWLDMSRYAIVDCEYAQYSPRDRRVIEIGIVFLHEIDNVLVPVDSYCTLINPGIICPQNVLKLTGISQFEIDSAPKFDQVSELIELLTRDYVLVGHNIKEDMQTLVIEFEVLGVDYRRKTLCTLDLAKTALPDLPSYELKSLCEWFHIPLNNHHRAYDDALATVQLFLKVFSPSQKKDSSDLLIKVLRLHPGLSAKELASWTDVPAVVEFYVDQRVVAIEWFAKLKSESIPRLVALSQKGSFAIDKVNVFLCSDPLNALLLQQKKKWEQKPEWNMLIDKNIWVIEKQGMGLKINRFKYAKGEIVFKSPERNEVHKMLKDYLDKLTPAKIVYRDPNDQEWKKEKKLLHQLKLKKLTESQTHYPADSFLLRFGEQSPCYFFEKNRFVGSRYIRPEHFHELKEIPKNIKRIHETPQLKHHIIQLIQAEKNRFQNNIEIKMLRSES